MLHTTDSHLIPQLGMSVTVGIFRRRWRQTWLSDIALCVWQVPSLSVVFVTQLEPASQIVICFLFAQPLVCKLLSVNQATNYTAAASRMEPFLPQGHFFGVKNITNCYKCWPVAIALLFFFVEYPGTISSLSHRHVEKTALAREPGRLTTSGERQTVAFRKFTWHFLGTAAEEERAAGVRLWQVECKKWWLDWSEVRTGCGFSAD